MNLLFLGGIRSFDAKDIVTVFKQMGYNVIVLNIHRHYFPDHLIESPEINKIVNLYEGIQSSDKDSIFKRVIKLIRKCFLRIMEELGICKLDKELRKKIANVIDENNIDVVYSWWGSHVWREVEIVRQEKPKIPIIHYIDVYPQRIGDNKRIKSWLEDRFFGKMMNNIDGRIHSCEKMYNFLKDKFNFKNKGKDLILMNGISQRCLYKKRLPLLSEIDSEPHIISIGRTIFDKSPIDDIRKEIYEITKAGIHFHFAETEDRININKYIHMFPHFDLTGLIDGSLSTFMTQFDACIVLLNLSLACERYRFGIPSRFRFAFITGIPIILPKGFFDCCEEIILKEKNGFTYKDAHDLKSKLKNKELMKFHRENAKYVAHKYIFEKQFHILDKFIRDIIGLNSTNCTEQNNLI